MKTREETSYGFVVLKQSDNKVLLIHQTSGKHWTLPKGHVEPTDRSPLDTAKRELLEETNLEISQVLFDSKVFSNKYTFIRHNNDNNNEQQAVTIHKSNHFYCGYIQDSKVDSIKLQKEEVLGFKFVDINQASDYTTFPTDGDVLKQVAEELASKLNNN